MELNLNPNSLNYETIHIINQEHKVYLVKNRQSGELCVKKILDIYNADVYRRLQKMNLPGMPCIMNIWQEDDRLVVVEEYISGASLADKISDSRLTPNDICAYFTDLRDILDSLHRQNPPIIHRDIKPSNIIINHRNRAILLDFNAAKNFNPDAVKDTVLIGTEGYAAPEQYGFGASMPQTDIYSLGIVLKEAVSSLNVPVFRFDGIIEKCTRIDPANRYRSAKRLKEDILMAKRAIMAEEARSKRERELRALEENMPDKWENLQVVRENGEKPVLAGVKEFHKGKYTYTPESGFLDLEHVKISSKYDNPNDIKYFIPPGFRALKPLYMIGMTAFYFICVSFSISYYKTSLLGGNKYALAESIWVCISLLNLAFVPCNFGNIQRLMPLCKSNSRFVRILGAVLLYIILFFGILLIVLFGELLVQSLL